MKDTNPKKQQDDPEFVQALKVFSPGTLIRLAIDDILRAEMGALIVVESDNLKDIIETGFRINTKFSPQKLVELAKMDGAIILSKDLKKIIYANAYLFPDTKIPTRETGTRHKSGERTAVQANTTVIAVSERRNKITLYHKNTRHELEESSEILRKATETLQILEKQVEIFDEIMSHLNILEINNLVTISDICHILQKLAIIKKVSEIVKRYLIELGREGIIVSMRLKELTRNLNKDRELILKDYFESRYNTVDAMLEDMNFDFLLETSNLSRVLFEELHDKPITSRGIRLLNKTNLLEKDIDLLRAHYKTLDNIFRADKESLNEIFKNENLINSLKRDLENLKDKILAGKKI
ncbi:MAG: DNA integrity scanning diadenylate cyclase DisA [Candidatus Pacearchaeota archaeon]|nr:DNA integrity scanning diadenylate cyclase DisA [Candidatus Pacearchaeota archaeon]